MPGHWSTLLVAGTGWVFVVGTRREPGDGLARSPFDGHDDTAAPGSSEAVEPATEGRAVRAPVSDRPVIGLSVGVVAATVRRPQVSVQEAAVSLLQRVLFYVGIDWAAETHAVCVLDATGRIRAQFTIGHTAAGFADLLRRLARLSGDPAEVAVGIERPDGRLVDVLLEAGYPVVPVSPNAIKTWRDGEVLSGAKSDAGDAAVIAEYLRLRAHRLQPATPYTAETKALRTVVRTREDVVDMRVAAANQLTALLDAHWPGAKAIFADVESAIALAFLTRYPTYPSAQHLGEKRLRAFCVKHGYSGRRSAAELLTRLRAAPAGSTDEALTDAVRDAVLAQVAVLTALTALTAAEKNLSRSVIA